MDYNAKDFGAAADGKTRDTAAIQAAIDCCSRNGGGRVVFSGGDFLTGTLYYKNGVELHIDVTARILAATDAEDYPSDTYRQLYHNETHMDRCLIYAHNACDIALTGRGRIDGNGASFSSFRPMMLRFHNCRRIRMEDVTLLSPASWTNAFISCEDVRVRGITITSRANYNGDGLDFNNCKKVFVSDSVFDCSDDCICVQNSEEDTVCEDIHISHCSFCSRWAGIRIGLLSCGAISDVFVDHCTFYHIDCSGLKIQSAEGSVIRNILCSDLIMHDVQRPIFVTSNRFRERIERSAGIPTPSVLENLSFHNIYAEGRLTPDSENGCIILDSTEEGNIRGIRLSHIDCTVYGGKAEYILPETIPTHEGTRAEAFNYGLDLPAYGLYARNVKDLSVEAFRTKALHPDARPMTVLENCGMSE